MIKNANFAIWLEKNKDALNKRYGFNGYDGTAYDTDDYSVRVTIVNGAEIVPADQKFVKIDSVDEIPEYQKRDANSASFLSY